MALISCPECNHRISDQALNCPNCGFPIGKAGSVKIQPGDSSIPDSGNISSVAVSEEKKSPSKPLGNYRVSAFLIMGFLLVIEIIKANYLGEPDAPITTFFNALGATIAIVALPIIAAAIATWAFKKPFFKSLMISCLVLGAPLSGLATIGKFSGSADNILELIQEAMGLQDDEEKVHLNAVAEAHPDWKEIVRSGKLDNWIKSLPETNRLKMERIRASGTTEQVIWMFDNFKRYNSVKGGIN